MLEALHRWLRKAQDRFSPTPAIDCVPDQTGKRLPYPVAAYRHLAENTEVPGVGDLIIELRTEVFDWPLHVDDLIAGRDTRWRVVGPGPEPRTVTAECWINHAPGLRYNRVEFLAVFYMRRHAKLPRVWFLVN